ncbi:MAG: dTMP kinase [Bdellovibrionales bacterium]
MSFIVFEGIDGAGKSSLMKTLKTVLSQKNISFIETREPGGTPLAEELRELIIQVRSDSPTPRAELLMYAAARAQHVDKLIQPKLDEGQWVISDRFTGSTCAFQKGGRNLSESDIQWLNSYATNGLKPDLNILLDLSVEESENRRKKRVEETGVEQDRFEQEQKDFHQRVRDAYLNLAKVESNWLVLNASLSQEKLAEEMISQLERRGIL